MNNAQAIFDGLDKFAEVQKLIGKQEDIFLDFKERNPNWGSPEKMSDDERRLFSKAASGFAHQEGGVLVWGIEAKKGLDGVDQAKALKPFTKVKQFRQALEEYTKYATEPIVDGVLHRPVFLNDNESGDEGFVVSYFPKSIRVHRALGGNTADFFKRHGDSFTPLSTEDVRALFFRSVTPDLQFVLTQATERTQLHSQIAYQRTIALRNVGAGVAKFVSLYMSFADPAGITTLSWYDGSGGDNFPTGKLIAAPHFGPHGLQFILNGDIPIYPEQQLTVCAFFCLMAAGFPLPKLKLKGFAEKTIPKEQEF